VGDWDFVDYYIIYSPLLGERIGYTLNQRLFLSLFFAIKTKDYFHKHATTDAGEQLAQTMQHFSQAAAKNEVLELVKEINVSTAQVFKIIRNMLMSIKSSDSIKLIITEIDAKPERKEDTNQKSTLSLDFNSLIEKHSAAKYEKYHDRATRIEAVYGAKFDQYFTNYSLNFWLGEWYTDSENLMVHTRKLLVRIACIRFMFFSHADIYSLLEKEDISGEDAMIDRIAVEVFYKFSRAYEHSKVKIDHIEKQIEDADYGLPVLASLIAF